MGTYGYKTSPDKRARGNRGLIKSINNDDSQINYSNISLYDGSYSGSPIFIYQNNA